jgi:hypothetical protein
MASKLWDRFEIHHTPVHASWLNQAEVAIGMYSRQCLGDGRVGDIDSLKNKDYCMEQGREPEAQVIQWRFTKEKARKSMGYQP